MQPRKDTDGTPEKDGRTPTARGWRDYVFRDASDREHESRRWLQRQCVGKTLAREKREGQTLGNGWHSWRVPFTPEHRAEVLGWFASRGIEASRVEFANECVPQTLGAVKLAEAGITKGVWVEWRGSGEVLTGKVLRVNTKTLTIRSADGRGYRVGLGGAMKVVPEPIGCDSLGERQQVKRTLGRIQSSSPKAVAAALAEAGMFVPARGQRIELAADEPITAISFKHEDCIGAASLGPVAVEQGGTWRPLVVSRLGDAEWFFHGEASRIAAALGLELVES